MENPQTPTPSLPEPQPELELEIQQQPTPPKHGKFAWLTSHNEWLKQHQKWVYAILVVVLIGVSALLIGVLKAKPGAITMDNYKLPVKKIIVSPLTGKMVKSQKIADRPVTAVMIENSPDARPQSGLNQAGVVFETVAEGGITRFEVLYQESRPKLVGPVRSLRPYFYNWATGFNASIAHVGGSGPALAMVRAPGNRDLDQFFNAGYYWRSSDRWAPHNMYTSFDKLDALNKAKGYKHSKFTPLLRKKDKPSKKPAAKKVNVTISSDLYNSSYNYNAKANNYTRYMAGSPHVDRESKKPITPKVVVVLRVPMHLESDGDHMAIAIVGQGSGYVFQDGTVTKINWNKKSAKSQIKLTDKNGKQVGLNAGMTWFTAIAPDKSVTWQ